MLHAPVSDKQTKPESIRSEVEQDSEGLRQKQTGWGDRSGLGAMSQAYGNQVALRMLQSQQQKSPMSTLVQGGVLQRQCACGNTASASGTCTECRANQELSLQTKLRISEPGDKYEREADLIANQVLKEPKHPAVNPTPLQIQRYVESPGIETETVPHSVHQVLSSPGQPLEPGLCRDMEQRFGYSFSEVRVHTGVTAAQSAKDVHALAYTVGHNVVFDANRFTPETKVGKQLIAHELTHVLQQSGIKRNSLAHKTQKQSSLTMTPSSISLQRMETLILQRQICEDFSSSITDRQEYQQLLSDMCSSIVNVDASLISEIAGDTAVQLLESWPWIVLFLALNVAASLGGPIAVLAYLAELALIAYFAWEQVQSLRENFNNFWGNITSAQGNPEIIREASRYLVLMGRDLLFIILLIFSGVRAGRGVVRSFRTSRTSRTATSASVSTSQLLRNLARQPTARALLVAFQLLYRQLTGLEPGELIERPAIAEVAPEAPRPAAPEAPRPAAPEAPRPAASEAPRQTVREFTTVGDMAEAEEAAEEAADISAQESASEPNPDIDQYSFRRRRRCRYPTGRNSTTEAIPMIWYKPIDIYPSGIVLDSRMFWMFHRNPGLRTPEPDVAGRELRPEERYLTVHPSFRPYVGKTMRRVQLGEDNDDRSRNGSRRFRYVLGDWLGYPWTSNAESADHVQDLAFGGPDHWRNIWPLNATYNSLAGTEQNLRQPVSWCPYASSNPEEARINQPIGHSELVGKWFVIRHIQRL